MTEPEATVALYACEMVPTVIPALLMIVDAAACVMPTTLGMAMGCISPLTVSPTAEPGSTDVPAVGSESGCSPK